MRWTILAMLLAALGANAAADSPYAAHVSRDLKALSPEAVDDLLNGRGMGLALAAELNHYPGPRHVLDHADALGLSAEQHARTTAIFDAMAKQARALGARLVELERALERRFADGTIDAASLRSATADIARVHGELRNVHLKAHLEQHAVLSRHQVHLYDALRGYGAGHGSGHGHSH